MPIKESLEQLNNTPDTSSQYDQSDVNGNKVYAVLSYIGVLVLIPLLLARESKYARFHINQGLVLTISGILVNIVCSVLSNVSVLYDICTIVSWIISLVFLVLMIIGIVNAVQGKAKELPVIGGFRILK